MTVKLIISLFKIVYESVRYKACLLDYLLFRRRYSESTFYENDHHAKVHCFSIYLMMKFINEPYYTSQKHYRSDSFLDDMKANLKNVAIPGTGIALSFFVYFKPILWFFILFFVPFICLAGAIHQTYLDFVAETDDTTTNPIAWEDNFFAHYYKNLLTSNNWFTLWRHNSHLVTYHSYLTHSNDYDMEDKWKFLKIGKEMNIPISPYFDDIETVVCKNILIEGGMGIHFFKNAIFGGNYIIQEKLKNALWLNNLLPNNAPLSTMRIITTSVYPLSKDFPEQSIKRLIRTEEELDNQQQQQQLQSNGDILEGNSIRNSNNDLLSTNFSYCSTDDGWKIGGESHDEPPHLTSSPVKPPVTTTATSSNSLAADLHDSGSRATPRQQHFYHNNLSSEEEKEIEQYIRAETAVLRLGRMNAATDHSSILFNVNLESGEIEPGQINGHWYQLGLDKIFSTSWLPPVTNIRNHLDPPYSDVAGKFVPDMKEAIKIVTR